LQGESETNGGVQTDAVDWPKDQDQNDKYCTGPVALPLESGESSLLKDRGSGDELKFEDEANQETMALHGSRVSPIKNLATKLEP
jgi:hypothetical protein